MPIAENIIGGRYGGRAAKCPRAAAAENFLFHFGAEFTVFLRIADKHRVFLS
jgi:hypothetical protein